MISIVIVLLCFFLVHIFIGQVIFPTKSNKLALFQPIIGMAISVIILSSSFLMNIPLLPVLFLILIVLFPFLVRRFNFNRFITHLSLFTTTVILTFLPYFLINGNNIKITGFMISNDTVIHALLSRTCKDNYSLYSKVYTSSFKCASEYPIGAHTVINLLSTISNIDTAFLVIPVSLFFVSFNSFIALYILLSVTNENSKVAFLISPVITASYFYLAIAYHGFLTQSAYVPFVLAFAFILFESKSMLSNNYKLFLLALFSASSIVIYSFVSLLAIIIFVSVYLFSQYKTLSSAFKTVILAGLICIVLIGYNNIVFTSVMVDIAKSTSGQSVIFNQSQSLGNLITFVDSRIGSGVWFEPDYRFMNQTRVRNIIQVAISTVITLIAFIFYLKLLIKRNPVGFVITGSILMYIAILFITGSPYSVIKTQSLLLIFIPTLFIAKVLNFRNSYLSFVVLIIFSVMSLSSNYILLKNISYLDQSVLTNLKNIGEIVKDKTTLFYTDNDWAVYYIDNEKVDITDIHYLRDYIQRDPSEYQLIIKDSVSEFDENCSNTGNIGNYYYCRL